MTTDEKSLRTNLAHAGWRDHILRGRSLFRHLIGSTSFWNLWSLALGGPKLSRSDELVLDALAVSSSAADPRLPPMKVIRLLGSYGGVMAAVAGGLAYQEEASIGTWTAGAAARDLADLATAMAEVPDGGSGPPGEAVALVLDSWRALGRRPAGFGVPARNVDERVVGLRPCLQALGRCEAPFWRLAEEVERCLTKRRPAPLNIAGAAAAACLDLGFKPRQICVLTIAFAQHSFVGNALEGAAAAPEILRRLPTSAVDYRGPPPRRSPRSLASDPDAP